MKLEDIKAMNDDTNTLTVSEAVNILIEKIKEKDKEIEELKAFKVKMMKMGYGDAT